MNRFTVGPALAFALALAPGLIPVAHADVLLNGAFSGIVDDGSNTDSGPVNTSYVPGQTIAGSFVFDATSGNFTSFAIGGYTAAPGFTTITSPPLDTTVFAYVGVQNPVANSAPRNSLQINFYYEPPTTVSTANIAAFIANPGNFSTNTADGSASYFAAFITNPNSSVTEVDGLLTSYAVTTAAAVPEPATLLLLGSGLAGFALRRRRAA